MTGRLVYERDGNRLSQTKTITTMAEGAVYVVTFAARNIRREPSGIHARIDVLVNGVTLAYSTFNIEKDEDRVRLKNSAFNQYRHNGLVQDYSAEFLKKDLDVFCDGLWDEQLSVVLPDLTYGSEERRPPLFRLKPFILQGGGTVIFSPPGRGKSYVIMLMAVSIDAGLCSIWQTVQTPVLFINLERSKQSVEDRLGNINMVLGLERRRPLYMLHARGRSLLDVAESVERFIAQHGIGCILLDSISRAGMGDLIKNQTANQIVDVMNGFGCDWGALAHTPRTNDEHTYGSVHFDAGADVMTMLTSQQESDTAPLGIGLSIEKANDIPRFPQRVIALEFDEAGLLKIREARKGEFPEVESKKKPSLRDSVRAYLLDMGKATASDVAEATGHTRPNVSSLFAKDDTFIMVDQVGREKFYGVRGVPRK